MVKFFKNAIKLYVEGFREMPPWGRQLWLIILLKLIILFGVFKLFFFPNYLRSNFDTDADRSRHVIEQITNIPK